LPGLQWGLDGYYKYAHNQLDDGLFGQTLILSAFNYREGRIYGVSSQHRTSPMGCRCMPTSRFPGRRAKIGVQQQFLFDPTDAAYVKTHWIYLDHDQTVSGSFGVSYFWKESIVVRGPTWMRSMAAD